MPGVAGGRVMSEVVDEKFEEQPAVPLMSLFLSFLKLGMTSFGGGMVGWTHREVVEHRKWMTDEKFLQMLTIAQVLPGANPVNMAVYIGVQLRGYAGATVAALGMIAMPFCFILLLAATYRQISGFAPAQAVLGGLACVGIASMLLMGIKSASRLKGKYIPICIAILIFLLVGVLRLSMVTVVLVALPASILLSYWLNGRQNNG
jgi:chromate transporter